MMDPLDEIEITAFEDLGCTHCATRIRILVEQQLAEGTITLDDLADIEILIKDDI